MADFSKNHLNQKSRGAAAIMPGMQQPHRLIMEKVTN